MFADLSLDATGILAREVLLEGVWERGTTTLRRNLDPGIPPIRYFTDGGPPANTGNSPNAVSPNACYMKSPVLGTKCAFKQQNLQMFGPK